MPTEKAIRDSLIKRLTENGTMDNYSEALVEEYIWLGRQVKILKKDLREKKMRYKTKSASGIMYERENPSFKNIIVCQRQQSAILRDLGLAASGKDEPPDGDDEL